MNYGFSERMVDQRNGFNLTMFKNSSLVKFTLKLTEETIARIEKIAKGNKIIEANLTDFSWEAVALIYDRLVFQINFTNPLTFSQGYNFYD